MLSSEAIMARDEPESLCLAQKSPIPKARKPGRKLPTTGQEKAEATAGGGSCASPAPPCQHQPHSEGSLPKPAGNCLAYWPGTSHLGPQGLRSSPALALPPAVGLPEPSPVALVAGAIWIAAVW